MERTIYKPFIILVVLMSLAALSLAFTVGVELDFVPGVVMELPEEMDDWAGNELRFCHNPEKCAENYRDASFYIRDLEIPDICPECGMDLYHMSRAEKEQLPDDTEFVKSAYTNEAGVRMFTSIVLSGTARDSIHRPQRCLKGQGNTLEGEYTLKVPMEGRRPLSIRIIKTSRLLRTKDGVEPYYSYYAYWFVGRERETPYHLGRMFWLAWDRVMHSEASRWAYIAVAGVREEGSTAYEEDLTAFVQKLYPHLLPDDSKLSVPLSE